jgi:hypothetical protein|tara:strand:- start:1018 stop:1200 length:183 start_codon:yes stop_codon:yes gene_type:complete
MSEDEIKKKEKTRKLTRTFTMNLSEEEFKKFEEYSVKIGVVKSRIVRRLLQKEGIFDADH